MAASAAEQIAADDRRLQIIQEQVDGWYRLPPGPLKDYALKNANASMAEKTEIEARRPALIRQRDEETGAKSGAHALAVKRLWAMATAVADGEERSASRKQLHATLALLVDGLYFGEGHTHLIFGGRAVVVRLDDGSVAIRGPGDTFRVCTSESTGEPLANTPDIAPLFAMTPEDVARRERFNQTHGV
jgi:hypothetical protein